MSYRNHGKKSGHLDIHDQESNSRREFHFLRHLFDGSNHHRYRTSHESGLRNGNVDESEGRKYVDIIDLTERLIDQINALRGGLLGFVHDL